MPHEQARLTECPRDCEHVVHLPLVVCDRVGGQLQTVQPSTDPHDPKSWSQLRRHPIPCGLITQPAVYHHDRRPDALRDHIAPASRTSHRVLSLPWETHSTLYRQCR